MTRRGVARTRVPQPPARAPVPPVRRSGPATAAEAEAARLGRTLLGDGPAPAGREGVAVRPRVAPTAARVAARLDGQGTPLADEVQATLGGALGHDFSRVRIHDDRRAHSLAASIGARAFTVGSHIVVGAHDRISDGVTPLLAHEAVHVAQQSEGLAVQRQEIPPELLETPNYSLMTDEELQARHDLIIATLEGFDQSTPETAALHEEAAQIGVELGTRRALAAGRTFSPQSIERMRTYFKKNAASAAPDSCIDTLNKGFREVLGDPKQPVGSEIQTTMPKLVAAGRASAPRVIEFNDASGKVTYGTVAPATLSESVWDALIAMAGGDPGWSVFAMSLMDGYHSVSLTLDNRDPKSPKVFWSDQWSDRGGWQEFTKATLDAEVTKWTKKWWGDLPAGKKHKTRVTLWRLHQ